MFAPLLFSLCTSFYSPFETTAMELPVAAVPLEFQTHQLQNHEKIQNFILNEAILNKNNPNHPFSNFLVLLFDTNNSFFKQRYFAGKLKDLTPEQLNQLSK